MFVYWRLYVSSLRFSSTCLFFSSLCLCLCFISRHTCKPYLCASLFLSFAEVFASVLGVCMFVCISSHCGFSSKCTCLLPKCPLFELDMELNRRGKGERRQKTAKEKYPNQQEKTVLLSDAKRTRVLRRAYLSLSLSLSPM